MLNPSWDASHWHNIKKLKKIISDAIIWIYKNGQFLFINYFKIREVIIYRKI
jgi:hypothetical protein